MKFELKFEVGHFILTPMTEYDCQASFIITGRTKNRLEVVDENTLKKQYVNVITFTNAETLALAEGVSAYSLTRTKCGWYRYKKGTYILAIPGNVPNAPDVYNICIRL